MKSELNWKSGVASEVIIDGTHTIHIDGSPDIGGAGAGSRPMDVVLAALMGCSSIDVAMILRKMKQQFDSLKISVDAQRIDAVPSTFSDIVLYFQVDGKDLNVERVNRAVELSVDKYCSVATMLRNGGVNITWQCTVS